MLDEGVLLEEALEMGIAADAGSCAEQLAVLTHVKEHCSTAPQQSQTMMCKRML